MSVRTSKVVLTLATDVRRQIFYANNATNISAETAQTLAWVMGNFLLLERIH